MTTTVTIPASLGGTNTAYNDGTGAYGMRSSNGYGYATYLMPMLSEVMAACQLAVDAGVDATQASASAATDRAAAEAAALEAQTTIPPVQVVNYTALRAYAGTATKLEVTGYLATAAPSGTAGLFVRDDSDTASADNGGTIIVASNGKRWKRLADGPYSVRWFGAVADSGVTDNAAPFQATATAAAAAGRGMHIPGAALTYAVGSTVTVSATVPITGDGMFRSIVRPTMTDASVCIQIAAGSYAQLDGFSVASNMSSANFLTGTANGQNCTGIALGTAVGYCNRYSVRNVRVFGCKKGWYVRGFIGATHNLWAEYNELGVEGFDLNSTDFSLRLENNRQDFAFTGGNAIFFRQLIAEGGNSSTISSTVDNCSGVTLENPYVEWGTYNRSTPYITFGGTTECRNVHIRGGNIVGGMAYGTYPIKLDRVDGAVIDVFVSTGDRNVSVETTANTKNYRLNATLSSKVLGVHDASKQLGACFNYFPNRNFDLWLRGFSNVVPTRATISQETTLVRKGGNAVKILCTAGQTGNYCQWQLNGPSVTYLRGKTVRAYAWVYVPDMADYDESVSSASRMLPALYIGDYDGANVQTSTTRNTGYKKGAWQLMESADLTVQTDATRIDLSMYANNSAIVATGDEYIVVDSVYIVESSTPFYRVLNDDVADSPYIDAIGVAGRMVYYADSAPADADQVFAVGDVVHKLTPAAGGSPGWVCTTGGAGGVAVFKAMASVAA